MYVTTIEGLAKEEGKYGSDIATTLAEHNGSQCGFCSPGWVMSMKGLIMQWQQSSPPVPLTEADIENHFDGHICRCTGYRPIMRCVLLPSPTFEGLIAVPT